MSCGSFDFARRLASLRMTLACEGSATQPLDATSCGSFDFARRLASLRMTLHSLFFHGSRGDACDELPLREQESDQHWNDGHHDGRHHLVLNGRLLANERQTHLQ